MRMDIVNKLAEDYASAYSSKDDDLLHEIAQYTIQHHEQSHMLIGHPQGKFLQLISSLLRPQKVLEIGTFTGYSALCLAGGLQPGGYVHTIEIKEEDAQMAKSFFSKSLHNNKILLHVGNALQVIPALNEQWDIIFIDADKINYINYYELTLPALKKNGLIIADNVLFHGEVLDEDITGKNAKAIHAFNNYVVNDARVEQVMITMRDGLSLIRKL